MKFILEERFILYEGTEDTINWEQEFAKCETAEKRNAFWDKYYTAVWGSQKAAIKQIGIESCLQALGWTEAENPLLAFLECISETPINGVGLKTITRADFKMLTTAFTNGILSEEDLEKGGKFGNYNLIYNPNLYTRVASSEDQLEYLRLQHAFQTSSGLTGGDRAKAFANIYTATGDSSNLQASIAPGGKLRDLKRMTRIIERFVPELARQKVKKISSSEVENLINEIKESDALIYFIAAFDTFETLDSGGAAFADKQVVSGPTLTAYRERATGIDHNKVKEASKKLKIKPGRYNNHQAAQLLIGLANKAGAGIKTKTEDEET